MSSSAISGIGGTTPAPLDPVIAANQASAQAKPASAPPGANGAQPILLIPTKPPLSAAVIAALLGQPTSAYGSAVGDYARNQKQTDTTAATANGQGVSSSYLS